ncbi:MAG: YybH family protein [Gammaproteobacteria bacterium]
MNKFAVLLLSTVLTLPAGATSEQTGNAIQATIEGLESALNDNDIKGIRESYTDNATLIPSESETLNNRAEIGSFWNAKLNMAKSRYHIDVIDFRVDNNIAYLSALWTATFIKAGIQAQIRDGYLSSVLERQQDGDWKIHSQTWD